MRDRDLYDYTKEKGQNLLFMINTLLRNVLKLSSQTQNPELQTLNSSFNPAGPIQFFDQDLSPPQSRVTSF